MTQFVDMLKEHGLKATLQRIAILSSIESVGHMDVEEIYAKVLEAHPTVSLATIYKNILTMVSKGVLVEIPISGKKPKYEISKKQHLHFICTQCSEVIDCDLPIAIIAETDRVSKQSDFSLHNSQINLYGICSQCAQNSTTV